MEKDLANGEVEKYLPLYFLGEILVCFPHRPASEVFPRELGTDLGYQLLGHWRFQPDVFIYQTSCGKEQQACADFRSQVDIVEWAERRDFTWEVRRLSLTRTIQELERLRDDCSVIPCLEYTARVEEIKKRLR